MVFEEIPVGFLGVPVVFEEIPVGFLGNFGDFLRNFSLAYGQQQRNLNFDGKKLTKLI